MLLTAVCCFVSALGTLLIKHSASVEQHLPIYRRIWWIAGFFFMVLLPLPINMTAMNLAPLALLAPFGGLTILFSLLLARLGVLTVRERTTAPQVRGVLLVLAGMVFVSAFGPHTEGSDVDVRDAVLRAPHNVPFIVLFLFCTAVILVLLGTWMLPSHRKVAPQSPLNLVLLTCTAGCCGALSNLIIKIVGGGVMAFIEGRSDQLGVGPTLLTLLLLGFFAPLELYVLNVALGENPVALAVPLFQSLLITLQIATGGTFFQEFESLSASSLGAFAAGAVLVCAGIAALSTQQARRAAPHVETDVWAEAVVHLPSHSSQPARRPGPHVAIDRTLPSEASVV